MRKALIAGAAVALGAGLRSAVRRVRRMSFDGKRVVITGGSRGLGLELARRFAGEGARVLLVARDGAGLERARADVERVSTVAGADRVLIRAGDLRDQSEIHSVVDFAVERWGGIDVLVNNAGVIQAGPLEHMRPSDFEEALAIHLRAPLHLMLAVIPHMKRQGGGRIVNISSIGGVVSIPHLLPYCTSKFALTGLSDGMRNELSRSGIRVTTVTPGLMRTGSHLNAMFKGEQTREFVWFALTASLPLFSMDSGRAARRIVEACRYGEPRVTLTRQARLLTLANTIFPDLTARALMLAARVLPGPDGADGDRARAGWELETPVAPSWLTRLADRAAERNNERPTGLAPA